MKQKQNQQKVEAQQARKPHIMTVVKRGRIQSVIIPEDFTVEVKFVPNYGIFTIYDNDHKVVVSSRCVIIEDIGLRCLSSCTEEEFISLTEGACDFLECKIKLDQMVPGAHHDLTAYFEAAGTLFYCVLAGGQK
jgi:hypothetical protein